MTDQQIWRDFYAAAVAFRDLKPWEWMYDSDIFGVEDPDTGEIGYCCIMGKAGEVFALGVYPGMEGFKTYLALINKPDDLPETDAMALGLNQLMLKVEFVDRKDLTKRDLDQLKELDLKFRGRNHWVQVRESRPGFFPWYVTEEQARFLTYALQQAVDVTQRYQENSDLLTSENDQILIRSVGKSSGQLTWTDTCQQSEMITINPFPLKTTDPARVKKAKEKLKKRNTAFLFALQYFFSPLEDPAYDRPFFPRFALWIDYGSGMMVGFQLIEPKNALEKTEEEIFGHFHRLGFIPNQIVVNSIMAYQAMLPISEALKFELILAPDEPMFGEAMEGLMQFL